MSGKGRRAVQPGFIAGARDLTIASMPGGVRPSVDGREPERTEGRGVHLIKAGETAAVPGRGRTTGPKPMEHSMSTTLKTVITAAAAAGALALPLGSIAFAQGHHWSGGGGGGGYRGGNYSGGNYSGNRGSNSYRGSNNYRGNYGGYRRDYDGYRGGSRYSRGGSYYGGYYGYAPAIVAPYGYGPYCGAYDYYDPYNRCSYAYDYGYGY